MKLPFLKKDQRLNSGSINPSLDHSASPLFKITFPGYLWQPTLVLKMVGNSDLCPEKRGDYSVKCIASESKIPSLCAIRVRVHFTIKQSLKWKPGLPWCLSNKESAWNVGDAGMIPGLGRSPGGWNGNPLQHFCLENSMDRGAWQATVHGVPRVGHDLATKPSLPKWKPVRIFSQKSISFPGCLLISTLLLSQWLF